MSTAPSASSDVLLHQDTRKFLSNNLLHQNWITFWDTGTRVMSFSANKRVFCASWKDESKTNSRNILWIVSVCNECNVSAIDALFVYQAICFVDYAKKKNTNLADWLTRCKWNALNQDFFFAFFKFILIQISVLLM